MNRNPVTRAIAWLKQRPALTLLLVVVALVLLAVSWRWRPASRQLTVAHIDGQWRHLPGPLDGTINCLLISEERTLYAGTDGGVFKSEDQGHHWISCNDHLPNRLVRAMAFDPDNPDTLYAGTWNGRVHVSTDAGQNWQERSHGLPPFEIRSLAVHTHDPRRLYAGMRGGVYTTISRGEQWRPANAFTGTLQCMVMDPQRPDTLYVGTIADGIQKSTDGGDTWSSLTTPFTDVSSLLIVSRSTDTLYAISEGKIYRSKSGGTEWTYVDSYRDHAVARSLAVNPRNADDVYVGLQDGLHKSEDARQTWFRSEQGITGTDIPLLAVDPVEGSTVYACSDRRLFVSTDAGRAWTQRSAIHADASSDILALEGDPKDDGVFYASVAGAGVYKTVDGGDHWQHVDESLPITQITAMDVDPVDTRILYLGIAEGFVFVSADAGSTLQPAGSVTEAMVTALSVDPEQPSRIYAGTRGRGLFRSEDSGRNWTYAGGSIGSDVQRIVVDSRGPHTTVYALTKRGVFRSHDSGDYWEPYLSRVDDIALPKGEVPLLVVTRQETDYVKGQGLTEVVLLPSSRVAQDASIVELVVGPPVSQAIYVLVDQQGVFRSTDLGESWVSLGPGLESRRLQAQTKAYTATNLRSSSHAQTCITPRH